MTYTWDFEEVKKIRESQPTEKDIDYLYQKVIKGNDLRNSIIKALKENEINTDFNIRSYIYYMNKLDKYKVLMKEKRETYILNRNRSLVLYNSGFNITEIALIIEYNYEQVYNWLKRNK